MTVLTRQWPGTQWPSTQAQHVRRGYETVRLPFDNRLLARAPLGPKRD